jgi:hypothetical protein
MYSVTFTNYEDDYKHRYDNGVYPSKPKIFKCKESAEKYICEELFNRLIERLHDTSPEIEDINDTINEYFIINDEMVEIDRKYKNDYVILIKIYNKLIRGEYVDYLFDWSIEEVELN